MNQKIHCVLHVPAGFLLIVGGSAISYALSLRGHTTVWMAAPLAMSATGVSILLAGRLVRSEWGRNISANLCLTVLVGSLCALCAEAFFRVIGYDFLHQQQLWSTIPIYYREPTVPTGEIFFRRSGPQEWTGQVLNVELKRRGITPNPYANEKPITAKYDVDGFRNSVSLTDWDIAIAGDSFTELGYLPDDDLFTSVLSRRAGVRVKNLGTSYTGPLTYVSYLEKYGVSASTRQVAVAFFEGNDLKDLDREYQAWRHWEQTGEREYRRIRPQSSVARAIYRLLVRWANPEPVAFEPGRLRCNASLQSAAGAIPLSLCYAPPNRSDVPPKTMEALRFFMGRYAAFASERHVTPWLLYMPCKERVLYGHVDFMPNAPDHLKQWRPTDLPDLIRELAEQYGLRFRDLTTALVERTNDQGVLLYNPIYDTHLNREGARVVGEALARLFGDRRQ